MGAARIIVLVVAAIAAIILMVIVGRLISHKPAVPMPVAAAPAKPETRVIVAARDLPIGTRLAAADMSWQPWPADSVNPSFITDGRTAQPAPQGATAAVASQTNQVAADAVSAVTGAHSPMDALVGAIVRSPILANEPITNAKLVRGGQGGYMAVVLRSGMRAIAVPVNVNTDAGGFVLPGDHVDVVQARQVETPGGNGQQKTYVAQTLLHNVRVLAIDQSAQAPKAGVDSVVGSVATLEVTPQDAELVAVAKAQGEVILTLRPYTDAGGPSGATGAGAFKVGTVRIIRNGQASDISVTP